MTKRNYFFAIVITIFLLFQLFAFYNDRNLCHIIGCENNQMNNLVNETSPYLLQHADNPVHWYPWGEEALMKAKNHDKPILLSIGYSSCHWCHVMEHESFEDKNIADIM